MFKAILHINPDNSQMKSKKTKESQVLYGKTILNILKDTLNKNVEIIDLDSVGPDDHVMFFMGNVPLVKLDWIQTKTKQYIEDVVFFKDVYERPIGLYIPNKFFVKYMMIIKDSWMDFSELLKLLEVPYRVECFDEPLVVMSKGDLIIVSKNIQKYINNRLVDSGVTFVDFDSTYVDFDVVVGMDTIIYPNTFLMGSTQIGEGCIIGPSARVEDSMIGDETSVKDSTVLKSEIASETSVGPYAYIRPNSKIGSHVKIGDFVEIKNAVIGDGTKISHLSYVGDADLGQNINVGCGVVFVNYNGKDKNRSIIKDDAFIGCNSNLVSPVVVEAMAYIAAGTTVTSDVPSGALAVGRAKQENKLGWVEKKQLISKSKK